MASIDQSALDILFNQARTHSAWLDEPVDDALLKQIYDLTKMAPTSANCQPLRVVFVKSKEAKERLKPCLDAGNVNKTMSAPVTAIIAYDMTFYDKLPQLFPHAKGMRETFVGNDQKIFTTAFRNGSLQGAYFILAARALGLDCGPMSGFDNATLDQEFLSDTPWKSSFLCNLGHGNASKLHPRGPRPEFEETCEIV